MSEQTLLNIGSFAMVSGLSVATLRHYDEVDLLQPAEVDPRIGYRRYHPDQVDRARTIAALRAIDLPVDDVRELLAAEAEDDVRAILVAHRDRLSARAEAPSDMVCQVETYIEKGVTVASVTGSRLVRTQHRRDRPRGVDAVLPRRPRRRVRGRTSTGRTGPHEGHITSFGLLVENVDGAHRHAVAAGGTEKWPPTDTPGMPRNSGLEDPTGNRIILHQG